MIIKYNNSKIYRCEILDSTILLIILGTTVSRGRNIRCKNKFLYCFEFYFCYLNEKIHICNISLSETVFLPDIFLSKVILLEISLSKVVFFW